MRTLKIQVLLCLLLITAFHSRALAHFPDQSYIYLQIQKNSVGGWFEISTRDLNKVFGLDLKVGLTKEDVAPHVSKIQEYVLQNASFNSAEEGEYQIRFTEPDILRAESFGDFVMLKFQLEGVKKAPEKLNVQYEAFIKDISGHTALLVIEENKNTGLAKNESMHSLEFSPGRTKQDVAPHVSKIQEYVLQNASFNSAEEGDYQIRFTEPDILRAESFGDFVMLKFQLEGVKKVPEKLNVQYEAFIKDISGHTALLVIEENKNTGLANNESMHSLEFSPGRTKQELSTTENFLWRSFLAMIKSGIYHIWIGFDHILFLLALLLPSVLRFRSKKGEVPGVDLNNKGWQPVDRLRPALMNIVKIVTFFTVAHSITLFLAAFEIINMPPRLIESIIAISIALAAIHNIYPIVSGKEWLIAFVFGLFHGFGFASVLAEKGLVGNYMGLSILGFNLGVEIGQLVIILLVFPMLFLLRKTSLYPKIRVFGSIILILFSLYWFIERAFNVDFTVLRTIKKILGL